MVEGPDRRRGGAQADREAEEDDESLQTANSRAEARYLPNGQLTGSRLLIYTVCHAPRCPSRGQSPRGEQPVQRPPGDAHAPVGLEVRPLDPTVEASFSKGPAAKPW